MCIVRTCIYTCSVEIDAAVCITCGLFPSKEHNVLCLPLDLCGKPIVVHFAELVFFDQMHRNSANMTHCIADIISWHTFRNRVKVLTWRDKHGTSKPLRLYIF